MPELPNEPNLPTMAPERAAELRRQATNLATVIIDKALSAEGEPSTDTGSSVLDRAGRAALRTLLPKLRATLLQKVTEVDPVALERLLGATATAIESVLYYSPGEPMPRWHFDWSPDGTLTLAPDASAENARDVSREASVTTAEAVGA